MLFGVDRYVIYALCQLEIVNVYSGVTRVQSTGETITITWCCYPTESVNVKIGVTKYRYLKGSFGTYRYDRSIILRQQRLGMY